MTYQTSVESNNFFQTNIVVFLKGEYFSRYQVDSGLVVPSENLIVDGATINPTKVSLKRGTQQTDSTTITFLDKDERFSSLIGADDGALVNQDIEVYLGRVNEAMDFADYIKINTYKIRDVQSATAQNKFKVKAVSISDSMQQPIFDAVGNLESSITDADTSLILITGDDIFQTSGILKIEDEYINYTGTTFNALDGETTFTGLTRGILSSTAAAHTAGTEAFEVLEIQDNPIDIFLKVLISPGGGGVYDTLHDGIGFDETLVDIAAIESIRDTFFSGDEFKLYLSNIPNALKWFETEIFYPNNLRLIQNAENNKISLAILDQSDFFADVFNLTEDNIRENPSWSISEKEVQNQVTVKYAWNEGLQRFTRTLRRQDADSIAKYGVKKGQDIEIKGAQVALNGDAIAQDRANRFLGRFSTPRVQVSTQALMNTSLINVGEKVRLTTSQLPQEGGAKGMSSVVEVLEKGINFQTGFVKYKLIFTSYSNLRIGVIAPAPFLSLAIIDQKTFLVPDGDCYGVGYALKLWDSLNNVYLPDPTNRIASIDGNQITMENDWISILSSNVVLKFADYDEASNEQRAKYAFVGVPGDFFPDGSKAYQIIL